MRKNENFYVNMNKPQFFTKTTILTASSDVN